MLYQQASANSINSAGEVERNAVTLHDPTRAKGNLLELESVEKLSQSVVTSTYNGRIYFPNLPPQLANRFYLDPLYAEQEKSIIGRLTLVGEWRQEPWVTFCSMWMPLYQMAIRGWRHLIKQPGTQPGISTDLVSYYRDHEDGTPTGKWLANDNSAYDE